MSLYSKPLSTGSIFNASTYNYQELPVTVQNLQSELSEQSATDNAQNALVTALQTKTAPVTYESTSDDPAEPAALKTKINNDLKVLGASKATEYMQSGQPRIE